MEKASNIYIELSRIQQALKAPKDLSNDFAHFKYRSAENILESVKPLLGEATIILSDDLVLIGDWHYVKSTVALFYRGEKAEVSAFARESLEKKGMDSAQITGAASSYARKYALCGLLAINDSSNDPDSKDNSKEEGDKKTWVKPVVQTKPDIGASKDRLIQAIKGSVNKAGVDILAKRYKDNSSLYPEAMQEEIEEAINNQLEAVK